MSGSRLRLSYGILGGAGMRPETRPPDSKSGPPSSTVKACHLHHCLSQTDLIQNLTAPYYAIPDNQSQSPRFFPCQTGKQRLSEGRPREAQACPAHHKCPMTKCHYMFIGMFLLQTDCFFKEVLCVVMSLTL